MKSDPILAPNTDKNFREFSVLCRQLPPTNRANRHKFSGVKSNEPGQITSTRLVQAFSVF
jgi:hypothetical protein